MAGEKLRVGAARRRRRGDARAARRHRPHHAVEFSDRDSRVEDRAGAGVRQHGGVQAGRPGARLRVGHRRDPVARGPARRRVQPGHGPRLGGGRGDRQQPRRDGDQLHGIRRRPAAPSPRKRIARMAKLQLEMGGKNPLVVLDDADLPTAVNVAVQGSYFSTGQRCTASSRLIVTAGIHDRFVAAVTEKLKTLRVDNALLPGTDFGPVVDPSQLEQDQKYLDIGKGEGREARHRRRALEARDRRLLPVAGALHRNDQRDAHRARGDLRPGRCRHSRQGLRRGAGASPTTRSSDCRRASSPRRSSTRRTSSGTRRPAW